MQNENTPVGGNVGGLNSSRAAQTPPLPYASQAFGRRRRARLRHGDPLRVEAHSWRTAIASASNFCSAGILRPAIGLPDSARNSKMSMGWRAARKTPANAAPD